MFGPRSSGKSMIALKLAEKLNCVILNADDVYDLCYEKKSTAPNILIKALKQRLDNADCQMKGYILVGFPQYEYEAKAMRWEVFVEAPLTTLIERASGQRLDPETGDKYHLIYNPPPNSIIEQRLVPLEPNEEQNIRNSYEVYMHEQVMLKRMFDNVSKSFDADQPMSDLFESIFAYISQPKRSVALRTPRIVLLGYSGSGKRVQGNLLAEKYGLILIDCGRLILQQIANRTSLGKIMRNYVHKNLPVPNNIVAEVIKSRLSQIDCITSGWILHGFPRNLQQAELLNGMELAPNRVFIFDLPSICAVERLTNRRIDPISGSKHYATFNPIDETVQLVQHPQDYDEVVKAKQDQFEINMDDLLEFYSDCLVRIRADRDVHTVFEEIEAAIVNPLPVKY